MKLRLSFDNLVTNTAFNIRCHGLTLNLVVSLSPAPGEISMLPCNGCWKATRSLLRLSQTHS